MALKKSDFTKNIKPLLFLFILITQLPNYLIGCGGRQKEFILTAGSEGTSYFNVANNISQLVDDQKKIKLNVLSQPINIGGEKFSLNAMMNCYLLSKKSADFAISQNDVSFDPTFQSIGNISCSNLRSILPLYSEIFFIIYKKNLEPKHNSLHELIRGRKVAMGPKNSGTARLTQTLFQEFGIHYDEYQPQYVKFEENVLSDTVDICCLVTGFNNPRIEKSLARGGKILSLGDPSLAGIGSSADGFCLKYPLAKPYIIPKNIFSNLPDNPVLTIAIDAVLLTREDMDDDVVYDIVETILNHKQFLVMDLNNKLLSQITEQFDPLKLRFPLHKGAKHYLERNKPTFYERYAELFGVIFSIFLAFIGAIATVTRWNKHRKKNRIDTYYNGVMDIQIQVDDFKTEEDCQNAIQELKYLRQNAFEQLISEKLMADESFRIFITFMNDTRKEINQRLQDIQGNN